MKAKKTSHTPVDDVGVEDGPSNPRFEIPRLPYCHLLSRSWPRAVGEWCHPDVEAAVLRTPPQRPRTWLGPRETASLLPLRPRGSSHWHGVEVVLLEAFHRRRRPLHNDPKFKFHSKTKTFFCNLLYFLTLTKQELVCCKKLQKKFLTSHWFVD